MERGYSKWMLLAGVLSLAGAGPAIASEADALAISRNIQARHLPYGTIIDPVFAAPDSNQIVSYTRCGDSAIWTGHYLAAEAFRYKVTGSAEALANVRSAIAGLKSLVDVTGTGLLARCLVPSNSPYAQAITQEEQANGIHTNTAAGMYWIGNTSRDQYVGVFFGLAVAFDQVDDAGVRAAITDLVSRMLDFLLTYGWSVVMPDGTVSTTFLSRPEQQLSLLQVGRHVNSNRYSSDYDAERLLLSVGVSVPLAVDVQSDSSYYKFNLDYITLYNLLRLEHSSFSDLYSPAYSLLRTHTKDHQNAFFNMIDRALNQADATRDAETVALLNAWLQRPTRDFFVDWRGKVAACSSDQACSVIPVAQRPPTDFLWQRSPFQLYGGDKGTIESAGIDYILPYWMARLYGIVAGTAVVSAATGGTRVAPESIASFYGSNLAAGTAVATSADWPTMLGGISVQVKDSAGVARPAPLYYVSSNQVNFEVPAGTATGQATFTIGTAVTTANVQPVAPGLFSADASGKGVAAALITVKGAVAPVFQCTNTGCSPIPINLSEDTPVSLSLYGTGLRGLSSLQGVSVTIHGVSVPVQFAGAQGSSPGLDQVNVALPVTLRGAGVSDVVVTVDGQAANLVQVAIQ